MTARRALRAVLAVLAVTVASVGVPAAAAPRSFYEDFPSGLGWVALLPPFNEHLVTDVGGLHLGFAVLLGWAAARPRPELVVPACAAFAVAAVLHLVFHLTHYDGWSRADAIGQTAALTAQLGLIAAALVLVRRAARQPTRSPGTAPGSGESSSTPSAL